MADDKHEELFRRYVRAIITYMQPFRVVTSSEIAPWKPTLNDINSKTWDCNALHEIAGQIDIGLPYPGNLVVCRDGAFVLPPDPSLLDEIAAVQQFNRCFSALLIGGVYSEAINIDVIEFGFILDWKYVRAYPGGGADPAGFHRDIRYGEASPMESIRLFNPPEISIGQLTDAMAVGLDVLATISIFSGDIFLRGVTALSRRDWSSALANLWISVEQLISFLWEKHIISPISSKAGASSRRKQLSDTRTWGSAARLELLSRINLLDDKVHGDLSAARRARNELSHRGIVPSQPVVESVYCGVTALLKVALEGRDLPLFGLGIEKRAGFDPFGPRPPLTNPTVWRNFRRLPGEEDVEKLLSAYRADYRATKGKV